MITYFSIQYFLIGVQYSFSDFIEKSRYYKNAVFQPVTEAALGSSKDYCHSSLSPVKFGFRASTLYFTKKMLLSFS